MSKKIMLPILLIVFIVVIVVGVIVFINVVKPKIIVSENEKKISQIDAKTLKNEIIEELKKSSLNTNNSLISTKFETYNISENNNLSISVASTFYAPIENYFDNFVFANMKIKDNEEFLHVPCFRITSNSNGKVENIEYLSYDKYDYYEVISNSINKVLKEKYNIDYELWSLAYKKDECKRERFTEFKWQLLSTDTAMKNYNIGGIDKVLNEEYSNIRIFSWNVE